MLQKIELSKNFKEGMSQIFLSLEVFSDGNFEVKTTSEVNSERIIFIKASMPKLGYDVIIRYSYNENSGFSPININRLSPDRKKQIAVMLRNADVSVADIARFVNMGSTDVRVRLLKD